jgi:hypothetical protein
VSGKEQREERKAIGILGGPWEYLGDSLGTLGMEEELIYLEPSLFPQ